MVDEASERYMSAARGVIMMDEWSGDDESLPR